MLPSDVVAHIASFLPDRDTRVVELVWRPKLPLHVYESIHESHRFVMPVRSANTGIKYVLSTVWKNNRYRTLMRREGDLHACECVHTGRHESPRQASLWLSNLLSNVS